MLDIRMITCVCADSSLCDERKKEKKKLFTKNSWTDKLGPFST